MPLFHAVLLIAHDSARIHEFDAEHRVLHNVQAHSYDTRQHGSNVRTEHEFFGKVCDALAGVREVLVAGSKTALSDFRHYVQKHRAGMAAQFVGWEPVDHPTDGQLVAFARKYFVDHDRMAGVPTPTDL